MKDYYPTIRTYPQAQLFTSEEIDVWEVFVKYDKYDIEMIHSWFFDNEQDARDKVRFVWDKWIDPPLSKYDICFYERVKVLKRYKQEKDEHA